MIRSAYFAAIADFCKQTFATQNFLMSQIFANIAILSKRKCGRVVECTGLENRRRLTPFVSSNLTASARNYKNCRLVISNNRLIVHGKKGLENACSRAFFFFVSILQHTYKITIRHLL